MFASVWRPKMRHQEMNVPFRGRDSRLVRANVSAAGRSMCPQEQSSLCMTRRFKLPVCRSAVLQIADGNDDILPTDRRSARLSMLSTAVGN